MVIGRCSVFEMAVFSFWRSSNVEPDSAIENQPSIDSEPDSDRDQLFEDELEIEVCRLRLPEWSVRFDEDSEHEKANDIPPASALREFEHEPPLNLI